MTMKGTMITRLQTIYTIIFFLLVGTSFGQVFWTEDFDGTPCTSGCDPSIVGWTINTTVGANGATANTWYTSCAENGNAAGMCGSGCGSDNSLHVGNVAGSTGSLLCPGGDCGAAYDASSAAEITHKRCESPIIDCTGQSNITLDFNYIEYGEPGVDQGELWYFDGTTWSMLDPLASTPCCGGPCTGLFTQGQWTAFNTTLPASADGNPNVRLAFYWENDGNGAGWDPSFAVDDLVLTNNSGAPLPVAIFTPTTPTICEGDCITFTDASTSSAGGITNWDWTFDTGGSGTVSCTGCSGASATYNGQTPPCITYSAAGTYTVELTVTDPNGTNTTSTTVTVDPPDDASFNYASATYCLTDPDPTPTITGLSGGTFSISGGGTINPSTGQIDIAATGTGSYTVTYMTSGPCPNSDTFVVNITTSADATITPAGPFCEGDPAVNLSAVDPGGTWTGVGITDPVNGTFNPATAGPGTHTITYTITGGCGDVDTETITVIANDDASFNYASATYCITDPNPTPTITGLSGGTFTISGGGTIDPSTGQIDISASGVGSYTVTYTTSGPCPDSETFNVTIATGFDATITGAGPFCSNDAPVNLTAVDPGGTWSGTGITDAVLGTFDPSVAGGGTHTITYTISGSCGDTDTEDIVVNTAPTPTFSVTDESCIAAADGMIIMTISGGTSPMSILWDNGATTSTIGPLVPGPYSVTITDANGCVGMGSATVLSSSASCSPVDPHVWVPNTFSPDGDMMNDILYVRGAHIAEMNFKVFNRWGNMVFESMDQSMGWDGTFNGDAMDSGVFVWFLTGEFDTGEAIDLKGNITLVR